MSGHSLSRRAVVATVVAGIVGAVLAGAAGLYVATVADKRYRAEMELALTPGPGTPPDRISDYWEALSRGQASRIAAEVLSHRRWRDPAAAAAAVRPQEITVTSGVIADTTLITVGVEAPSARAAEVAVDSLVREAAPTAERISGPFTLQVVQTAAGGAVLVSTPRWQTLIVSVLAGVMVGSGSMLLVQRARARRPAAPPRASASAGDTGRKQPVTPAPAVGGSDRQAVPAPQPSAPPSAGPQPERLRNSGPPRPKPAPAAKAERPSPAPAAPERPSPASAATQQLSTSPAVSERPAASERPSPTPAPDRPAPMFTPLREHDPATTRAGAPSDRGKNGTGHPHNGVPVANSGSGPRSSEAS